MRRAGIVLMAVGLLAACAGGAAAGPDVAGEWELVEGTASGVALPRPAGASATLEFGDDELRGRSFCNHFLSGYRLAGGTLSLDGLGGTEMGCEPDVMAAEQAFLDALGRVTTVVREGEELVLTGDGVRLRFAPVAPVKDRPLEGTRWVLETLIDGETAASTLGDPAVLVLDPDRTAEASTGCRRITGTWLLDDGTLVIDDLLGSATCPPELAAQDAHVSAVLGSGPAPVIEGDGLTLTAADGRGLGYRAEAATEGLLGSWVLAEGVAGADPLDLPAGARATLTFSPGSRAGGSAFCNGYGGSYVLDGDELRLEDVAVSLVMCEGPVGAAEGTYLDLLLDRTHRVAVDGDRLVLESGAGRLSFDRLPPVPVDALVDRRWVLESVDGTAAATGSAALALRSDGTATVSTGCRGFAATWQAAGDTVHLADWEYELIDCPAEIAGQDDALVQVLGGGFQVQADGDVLTVTAVDNRGAEAPVLVYRAAA